MAGQKQYALKGRRQFIRWWVHQWIRSFVCVCLCVSSERSERVANIHVFRTNSKYFGFVQDTFLKCGELVGGFASLLWLAPDHVHIYVESDGEKSVETIIHKIKEFSKNAIIERFPDAGERVAAGIEIWDEAYFAETMG